MKLSKFKRLENIANGLPEYWREKGDEFNPLVLERIFDLYEDMTFLEVHAQIQREFPDENYSLARIRQVINKERRRLADEASAAKLLGDHEKVIQIQNRIKDEFLDKRSRLKRDMDYIIDETVDEILCCT